MKVSEIVILFFVILELSWPTHNWGQSPARTDVGQLNRTLDEYMQLPGPSEPSKARDSQIARVTTQLQSVDQAAVSKVIVERAANAPTGRDLSKYRDLIKRTAPTVKSEFFSKANVETDPSRKRKFIRLSDALWSQDAARFLVAQLDDKRSAETHGDVTPSAVRICDVALNVLHAKIGGELDVHIGVGGGIGGDAIVPDVPIEKRDQWIAKFKNALIAKYGADLNVPENK